MAKFELGTVYMTRGISDRIAEDEPFAEWAWACLLRHASCDWGDLDPEDTKANDDALVNGDRLFSAYKKNSDKIWIITEWDRSATTILFPDEY